MRAEEKAFNPLVVDTEPSFDLGLTVFDKEGKAWIYVALPSGTYGWDHLAGVETLSGWCYP